MALENVEHDPIVLARVARPMHLNAVRARIRLELIEIRVQMRERMLLDGGGQVAQLLPLRNAVHLAVTLLAQVPEPLVVHLLVLGRGDKPICGFALIDRPIASDPRAARLRLVNLGPERRGRSLRVIEAYAASSDPFRRSVVDKIATEDGLPAHERTPFKICAMWIYFCGIPNRSAHPCWCSMQELSEDVTYSAPD